MYVLHQSGTGWAKCGLTPEWGSLTPNFRGFILVHILGHEIIVEEGDAIAPFLELRMVVLSLH